jgi:multiple sugar transport system permease protein/putative aldouronate transport system permease protein
MAITVICVIPVMLLYPLLQKHFAEGIMIGAVKS